MTSFTRLLFPAATVTAALLVAAPGVCTADDESLDFDIYLDVGELGDYMVGDFAAAGAIQDEGTAVGQYVTMSDGTLAFQLSLYGERGDLLLVIHNVQLHLGDELSVTMSSDLFTLDGDSGGYSGAMASGSALGYRYITDATGGAGWWYPSNRENWLLLGELSAPFPPPTPAPLPELAIDDVSIVEGRRGTRTAYFTVMLSTASKDTVSVAYATEDGTALVSKRDYEPVFGVLTLDPGDRVAAIPVTVRGDRRREPDETFFVYLGSPIGAVLADDQGIGTILNDD